MVTMKTPAPGNILISMTDGEASTWVEGDPTVLDLDKALIMTLLEDGLRDLYERHPERRRPPTHDGDPA